jgi:hypothetical protein
MSIINNIIPVTIALQISIHDIMHIQLKVLTIEFTLKNYNEYKVH